jgi:hypothetical protein
MLQTFDESTARRLAGVPPDVPRVLPIEME